MSTQLHTELIPELLPGRLAQQASNQSLKPKSACPKKKLVRRTDRDYSQAVRRGYQFAFLLMNVWLGGLFYIWVRHFEVGTSTHIARPAGVEGWLPIAGMMNFKYWLLSGQVPSMHPAAMFLLLTFASIAFLFRKAFCSWLCPVGTLSEVPMAGRKARFRPQLPDVAMARHPATRTQIPTARLLCMGGIVNVGEFDCCFHAQRLWTYC